MPKITFSFIAILLLFGCEQSSENNKLNDSDIESEQVSTSGVKPSESDSAYKTDDTVKTEQANKLPASAFMSADWVDLIPKDDLEMLLNPPSYIAEIAENSADDQLSSNLNNSGLNSESNEDRYQQALASTRVITAINDIPIRLPAFIVPLEFDDEQKVTQFFMVPYFGACIHLPPPPPNQTIFVKYPQGFVLESLTEPFWISGIIKTSVVENDVATSAYIMEAHIIEPYTGE